VTEELKDKPKDIPMPVPSIGAEKPKPKEPTKSQSKIDHDSDPPDLQATPTQPGQIDTGVSPVVSPFSDTPVSPPASRKSPEGDSKEAPALPFDEGDLMSKQATSKPNVPATRKSSSPAVAGGPTDLDLDRQISDKKTKNWLTNQGAGYKVQGKYRPDASSQFKIGNMLRLLLGLILAVSMLIQSCTTTLKTTGKCFFWKWHLSTPKLSQASLMTACLSLILMPRLKINPVKRRVLCILSCTLCLLTLTSLCVMQQPKQHLQVRLRSLTGNGAVKKKLNLRPGSGNLLKHLSSQTNKKGGE